MNQFIPKNYKYKKVHTFKSNFIENKYYYPKFGTYGLKALTSGEVNTIQLEAVRRTITRKIKKIGKFWITIRPNRPKTSKPVGTRMGKGKGNLDQWVFFVKKGRIIIELDFISSNLAYSTLLSASKKLPIKCKVVQK